MIRATILRHASERRRRRSPRRHAPEGSPEEQETAARLSALLRHLFLYDRGNLLRVIEECGLSMTQFKALLELGGLGEATPPRQVSDLAETFGVSVPSMSRAVDGLVKKAWRPGSRTPTTGACGGSRSRPRASSWSTPCVVVRQAGIEAFAATLSAAQRRKLDAAVDALMDRDDIADDLSST